MTGEDFKLSGTRADFDTSPGGAGRPIVTMEFTGAGCGQVRGDHARTSGSADACGRRRSTSRSSSTARSGRSRRSTTRTRASPAASAAGGRRSRASSRSSEAKDIAIVLQTGALPVKFETLDRTDISATLGKDSLEEAQNAAIGGLLLVVDLPAALLPLPRARRGRRTRHLRRLPVRDDPALQRDADAAGVRRPRADVRRRSRREHRHLRTHQGRGARREIDARRDRPGISRRASRRSSTRTS